MENICIRNNCGEVFIDTNPSVESVEVEVSANLRTLTEQTDTDGTFQGCPTCSTDGYLSDVTGENVNQITY